MNKKFDIITIVLMVILCIMLVFVIFNYFMKDEKVTSSKLDSQHMQEKTEVLASSGDINLDVSENVDTQSGDDIETSGDSIENDKAVRTSYKLENSNSNPIIKSNGDISSKEKREVLQELDQTLMELFDVVDKVTIVDETRLINDESEDEL